VSPAPGSGPSAVRWLTAQSFLFGIMAALLGVVANAMFLAAYGSAWLPVTYILIGVAGAAVSGTIARSAQRFDLVRVAISVLGGAAVLFGIAWVIAAGGEGAWVSVPLLVLFPILIQLGFVFIGAQAGRILDIAGIKAGFGRIMTGFPAGAVVGGLLAAPLVGLLGRTEGLLLATAIAEAGFAILVWVTGRRYAGLLAGVDAPPVAGAGTGDEEPRDPSLRRVFGQRFVVLLLAYQVLSALGSQLADFLVYDRATALFTSGEELARYFAGYTAVMNIVSIAFLFLLAGPLLRRHGLRLGIAANPLVVTVLAALMIVVLAAAGAASAMLLAVVSATRIADIALSDGTTRTSINALYQVLPTRTRLPVQTTVEGVGVPAAIAVSGVLILVLDALPGALEAMIVALVIVCAVWTWAALLLYRSYGPSLVHTLRRRRLLDPDAALQGGLDDARVARRLLVSGDARSARLGLDLASTLDVPGLAPELAGLSEDPRADVRLIALAGLAAAGDAAARRRLATEVRTAAVSPDPMLRRTGAVGAGLLERDDRAAVAALLDDGALSVRLAALESVQDGDTWAVAPAVRALEDPRSAPAAMAAIGRLGDAAVPALATMLEAAGVPGSPVTARVVRAVTTPSPARDAVLARHLGLPDRTLGRLVLDRLVRPGPATAAVAEALDATLLDDLAHAVRVLGALTAVEAPPPDPGGRGGREDPSAPLRRALHDELDLVRERVVAGRLARHGRERLGAVLVEIGTGERTSLAAEALEVVGGSSESRVVIPLLDPRLTPAQRLERLAPHVDAPAVPGTVDAWLTDLVEDPGDRWRSGWLRACAIRAAAARGLLGRIDSARAGALGDPVVDEELARAGGA
jgi:hypothetical protein